MPRNDIEGRYERDAMGRGFEWRARTGYVRWLILGALGAAQTGCGGRTEAEGTEATGDDPRGRAGASPGETGTGGATVGPRLERSPTGTGGTRQSPRPELRPATTPSACSGGTGIEGGFSRCDNGMVHRPTLGACTSKLPRSERVSVSPEFAALVDAGVAVLNCSEDSDCTEKPHGYCESFSGYETGTYCQYGCVVDSDCGLGMLCACDGGLIGHCIPALCHQDADCPDGSLCADFGGGSSCGSMMFSCQTPTDACAVHGDCAAGDTCVLEGGVDSRRVCVQESCAVPGRPFLVEGRERLAQARVRADWRASAADARADVPTLAADVRAAVIRGWTEQGLMEHASVAAFARFALQLASLGAPPELLSGTALAIRDEIRHAQACFALARRHSGLDVGPGPLSMDGALEASDLRSVVLGTIAEGCIGETVAALEAAEALEHCEDAATRDVLARIAADEARHAELAWRFVAWALATGSPDLRAAVREAFDVARADAPRTAAPVSASERELLRHGLMGPALRDALRRRVLEDVITPCVRALLEPNQARAARAVTVAPKAPHPSRARAFPLST